MPLTNLLKRINALTVFDVEKETIDIINKNQFYITALLRLQLQEGKDANDEPVKIFGRDYYSDRTIFDKEHGNYPPLGKQTEWITNYRTGAFYASLVTVAEGRIFKTESDVAYFDKILERSGDVIMKLNKKHLSEFAHEILIPELRNRWAAISR